MGRKTTSGTTFVIDDDPTVLDSLPALLERAGLRVATYTTARDALAAYEVRIPRCIILSLHLPDMDGLKFQRKLVRRADHPPIIFISDDPDIPTCVRALKAGAFDFLTKPVGGRILLTRVRQAIQQAERDHSRRSWKAEIKRRVDLLTPREWEVACLLFEGKSIKQIARHFGVSFQTVAKHRARLLEKMGVSGEAGLARMLSRHRGRKA